jgi:hypothetical protein
MEVKLMKNLQIIWDYLKSESNLQPSDLIWVLCSHDLDVARHASELFLKGFAPKIIFTGGYGKLTENNFVKPEADIFADIAVHEFNIPRKHILVRIFCLEVKY